MRSDVWNSGLIILDGAMGTMLQRHGLQPGECPEMWNLRHPERLEAIHKAYIDAGSQVVYANTFGANRRKLTPLGTTVDAVVSAGIAAARRAAAGTDARVALDIGPLGELLEPMGSLTFEDAMDRFKEIALAGAAAGADLAVIETMTDLSEARAAVLAVRENTDLPILVSLSFGEDGRTFTGCTPAAMARTLSGLGVDAVGVNCSLGPVSLAPIVAEIARNTKLPVLCKPNAGLPDPATGSYDLTPEDFAQGMLACLEAGAAILGGCCGTTPEYIAALKQALEGRTPAPRAWDGASVVCSATNVCRIDGVRVIGERVNPTGKKRFQQALLEQDLDYILEVAIAEEEAGADILDVNVGYPGVDEADMLPRVVKKIQSAVSLPLQLDTTNPAALEAGLKVYTGKAAVNSVNGNPESMEKILPLVKKYGASVVALTLDDQGIPQTAEERVAVARRICTAAEETGIPREDIWVDCLTLTVSAQQEQARETLRAVRTVREEMGLQTVLGVSNISFGLPNRPLITQTFLVEAMHAGLTLPILNPNQREMMDAVAAFRVLSGEDEGSTAYVDRFAGWKPAAQAGAPAVQEKAAAPTAGAGTVRTLQDAIVRGMQVEAAKMAQGMLETESELSLVEQYLIPALDQVGEDYGAGKVFLPQLLRAAQAAQSVFEVLRTSLAAKGGAPVKKGRLILATVKGDIHDIGKNIVKVVLENYGYEVLDLGRDVPPETVAETCVREHIPLVGLSALMTTTLPAMEETLKQLKALPNPPLVMGGGAVLTPAYAEKIGLDFYSKDARDAVEIARKVFGN